MAVRSKLAESEKRTVDTVLALVLYAVGIVLVSWGFSWLLYQAVPKLTNAGADVVIGAIVLGISVSMFKLRV